ncbi:iron-containing alcohol dehydrogenase [Desulforhopalus sp. IMCC35007]|uniref:iron-containing alcohol dehydrogenase n=1 Tax=Desulforhopalus sp. IMCC35007 TaxID=2569543 RepID=UPI0010AE7D0F|nr:iron-containing alcohol dehydrogenase [Desulforhopalus sp. IMCC35007]TKB05848.1 iron-containing alcohol dehydrogenase [Desulforhopalus sp. IMCC35007]
MSTTQIFQTTPRIIMGAGSLKNIVPEIKRQGCQKVFIVTDPGIVSAGIAGQLETLLQEGDIAFDCFDKVEPDPRIEIAIEAAVAVKTFGADIVIGIGGGSAIDIAKISAILANNEGSLHDFFGIDLVPNPGLKTIIIPTTAGTGSEVTPIVILSDEAEKLKKGVVSPYLFPTLALLDPELTVGLPAKVTAATGMDALIHAIEAFTSKNSYGFTDMLAREAIVLIAGNIRTAYANGTDMEARSKLLEGSLLAGMAFANAGVTAVHAFAYPIGAEFHIPHGVANSIMLVPVMEFNMIGNLNKFAQLADLLGEKTDSMNLREKAQAAVNALRTLTEDLEIPKSLSQFKITDSDLPMLAEGVMKVTRLLANNPRAMSADEAEGIYRQVL